MAAEESDVQTFWVITSRAKGGANNPFGGSANSNQTSQLVQMTEQDLYQEYQDSGQLQDLFGSWDNYKGYVIESQEFIQTADWMTATPEYKTGSREWAFLNGEDLAWRPGEREKIQEKIIADRVMARTAAFNEWIGGEQGQALMQKYGIEPIIYNNDGDQFKWTGSGYQKTIKVDDHAGFADYVKAVLTSVVVGGVTGQLFNAAYSALGAVINPISGSWGTAGQILGEILAGGAGVTTGGIAYEDAMNAINNPNVIVNLQDALDAINNQGGNTQGDDDTTRYYPGDLPPGYIYDEARKVVIHQASGAEYPVTEYSNVPGVAPYSWYVDLPPLDDSDGGGNTGSTDGSTSGGSESSSSDSGGDIGGEDSDRAGSIVARQLHEAILKEKNPDLRDALIDEWERYTGEKYSDDFYDDNPYKGDEQRTPIGWKWIPGDNVEGGLWYPVYDPSEIPSDGPYYQGATAPTEPPDNTGDNAGDTSGTEGEDGDPNTIIPSLICESGWVDGIGVCVPADDPRIAGVNTPVPGQCPPGYSKNRRGECIPNVPGDMGGDSEGDSNNGSTPNDGEPCEVDGKKGTYQDGVCVISTNTVNPGVIDLTGDSEWGNGGDGGGDNGGDGPGDGPGDGKDGNGGPGLGDVAARKGSSNPVWSPIPPGYQFRRFQKRQGIGANAPMLSQQTFQPLDLSPMRKGLLTSMQNDLKKV